MKSVVFSLAVFWAFSGAWESVGSRLPQQLNEIAIGRSSPASAHSAGEMSSQRQAAESDLAEKISPNLIKHALQLLGRLHVVVVHFPIALIIAAAFGEGWSICTRSTSLAPAVRFCLLLGAAGAAAAALLGWLHATLGYAGDPSPILALHRWIGTAASLWAVALAVVSEIDQHRGRRTVLFRAMLFVGALLVGLSGHFGGLLTHGTEFFSW